MLRGDGHAARRAGRRQRAGRPRRRAARRARLVRQERERVGPRPRLVGRARVGRHDRAARCPTPRPSPTGAGRVPRASTGCPTGAIVAPGVVDARRCLAWLVQAPGDVPASSSAPRSATASTAATTARRCARPPVPWRAAAPAAGAGRRSTSSHCATRVRRRHCLRDHGRWYIAKRDPRLRAAQRARGPGQHGDPADERVRRAVGSYVDSDDGLLAEHARWAMAPSRRASRVVSHLLVTNDFRRSSAASRTTCGSCGAACPTDARRSSPPPTTATPRSTPTQTVPDRARRLGAVADCPTCATASSAPPTRSTPSSSCWTRPTWWVCSAPRSPALRGDRARRRTGDPGPHARLRHRRAPGVARARG